MTLLCDLFKIDLLKLDDLCLWSSFADVLRLVQSFWRPPLLQRVPCFLCCVQFVPLCQQPELQTELPSELPTDFSVSTSISCFLSSASFASIDLASSAICDCLLHLLLFLCHTLPHIVRFVLLLLKKSLFSTRQLSVPQLGQSLCFLGNLQFLLCCNVLMTFSIFVSRHQSNFFLRDIVLFIRFSLLLAMLFRVLLIFPCCWVCSSRLLLAVLFCVLTRLCHFVQLSELLLDLLLVVVQVLRLCDPFRQSGVASFVDFFSPLALLAVVLSLFSVFWRPLLQHYFVAVYCSEVRLKHLQRHHSVCATS